MKTEEKTSMDAIAQVIFRPSSERRGYYLCHYGHLTSDGSFSEAFDLSLSEFLDIVGVPAGAVAAFVKSLGDSELEICGFGYLSQEHFDGFFRSFLDFCGAVQLYPGMLVLTFNEKEDEV